MNTLQACKYLNVIPPAVLVNGANWTCLPVDTLGYDYCTLVLNCGATNIAMAALEIQESETNGSFSTIAAANFTAATATDIDGTAIALPTSLTDNDVYVIHIDLRKRKRWLNVLATGGVGNAYLSGVGILSGAEIAPLTAANMGAATPATVVRI